ncbi:MAG: sensor domain-containing diguanylate cyclase [Actinomycetota bacterium]|nr:sensor domain-containing diguanylate cyclase [Actinomycetota bacterium]
MRTNALWTTDKNALPSEMVSLSERLSNMLLVRAVAVAAALSSGLLGVDIEVGGLAPTIIISALYLMLSIAAEGARRLSGGRGLVLIGMLLLVDGVYLAWITYSTGGTQSPLRVLLYAHLIAVTLLASYRTGLKIALWHSLLLFVVFYSQLAGFMPPVEVAEGATEVATSPFHRASVHNVMAFWFVAMGTAAFSAFNERNLRRRGSDLEALSTLAAEMDNVSNASEAARCLVDVAAETFSFRRTAVVLMVGETLTVAAERGCRLPPGSPLRDDASIREVSRSQRTIVLRNLESGNDPALASLFPGGKRVVLVPLTIEGKWVGALVAEGSTRRRNRVDASVVRVVEQFATHAALALSNVWLLEQVKRLAETDSLTGVANRLLFDRVLSAEFKRAERSHQPLGLVMIDIDHFKTLNDRFGHQTGDDILRKLAAALVKSSRDFNTVARYGGEEFAVILPGADRDGTAEAGERFRAVIEQLDTAVPITVSVGAASFPLNAFDRDELVRAADDALYQSKRSGRNRVTASIQQPTPEKAAG